jgi:WD40 repeat protein
MSGILLALASKQHIDIVREDTHEPIATFATTGFVVSSLAFAPDGSKLAAGMRYGPVCIWDIETNTRIVELKHDSTVYSVQFSQDSSKLMTCAGNGVISLWNLLATEIPEIQYKASQPAVWATAYFCVNDEHVVTFGCSFQPMEGECGILSLHDIRTGSKLTDLLNDCGALLRCVSVNSSENVLAVGTSLGCVIIMNLETRTVHLVLEAVFAASVKLVGLNRQAQLCVCCDVNGDMCAINLITNSRLSWPTGDCTLMQLVVCGDGSRFGMRSWRTNTGPGFFIYDSECDSYVSQEISKYEYCEQMCYSTSPLVVLM